MGIRFCCTVCPHEVSCYDIAEATFADPEDVIADEADQ